VTRLTTAQALVAFLRAQWTERDGERRRAIPAMFWIFGHGNVCSLSEALATSPRSRANA
jgi:3D-(3,5/4)-trihydroxycyclohexane-1,2-dione acylhydrolase (decyclizing)